LKLYKPLHKSQDYYANNCKIVQPPFRDRHEIFSQKTALAGSLGGEEIKKWLCQDKNDDDFWNLETESLWLPSH